MKLTKSVLVLLISFVLVFATACGNKNSESKTTGGSETKNAEAKKVNFPAKDITWIVPVSAGGSYDSISRVAAEYFRKYLPKNVPIVVKNMPGGDWAVGLGELIKSKPDGHTLSVFNVPANAINQIKGAAPYDLKKVEWIGRITSYPLVGLVKKDSKIKSIDDFKKATNLKAGTVGLTSGTGISIIATLEELGVKNAKIIPHNGSSEAMTALLRGDIDYYPVSLGSSYDFIKKGDVTPLFVFADERLSLLPDVPTIKELGYPQLIIASNPHTSIGLPAGTPKEIVDIWRDAFAKVIKDKDFEKKLLDMKTPLMAGDAQAEKKFVEEGFQTMEKILKSVSKYE